MSDFYAFAGAHPILTVILAAIIVGGIASFRPFARTGADE